MSVYDPNYNPGPGNDHCRPAINIAPDPNSTTGTIPTNDSRASATGGYVAVYRGHDGNGSARDWWSSTHLARDWYCQKTFNEPLYNVEDPTANDIALKICNAASTPYVETVFQVYVNGGGGPAGCEAASYVSGYPMPTSSDAPHSAVVKNWFRNGELRLTKWTNIVYLVDATVNSSVTQRPTDIASWRYLCNKAFTPSTSDNWFYTGIYKLDSVLFQDWGDAGNAGQYVASSCPQGWTPNAQNSCEPHEGASLNADGTCNNSGGGYQGYNPTSFADGPKCMMNYP